MTSEIEKREEERGRMTGNNLSLEGRPHIEKLLSNNTGHVSEHANAHKISPSVFRLCAALT